MLENKPFGVRPGLGHRGARPGEDREDRRHILLERQDDRAGHHQGRHGLGLYHELHLVADDKDPKNSMAGRCVGSGGLVAGKFQAVPFFCNVNAADGSTYMVTGTGAFEGISGTVKDGQQIDLPAPQGEFAACRPQTVERTTPG